MKPYTPEQLILRVSYLKDMAQKKAQWNKEAKSYNINLKKCQNLASHMIAKFDLDTNTRLQLQRIVCEIY